MQCPFCNAGDTKVIDSRLVGNGNQVRRRRECLICAERFTTYEVAELALPYIIKREGNRVPFDMTKLRSGMLKALEKRPVSVEQLEASLLRITHELRVLGEREVATELVGKMVMDELRKLDKVAYVRFASVYRSFEDVEAFRKEIDSLQEPVAEPEAAAEAEEVEA